MGRGSLGYLPGRGFRPVIANCSNGAPVTGLDRSCLIDGEAIVCDNDGLAVFDLIRPPRRARQRHSLHVR
jgi:ATP-dependent DNA ligase